MRHLPPARRVRRVILMAYAACGKSRPVVTVTTLRARFRSAPGRVRSRRAPDVCPRPVLELTVEAGLIHELLALSWECHLRRALPRISVPSPPLARTKSTPGRTASRARRSPVSSGWFPARAALPSRFPSWPYGWRPGNRPCRLALLDVSPPRHVAPARTGQRGLALTPRLTGTLP